MWKIYLKHLFKKGAYTLLTFFTTVSYTGYLPKAPGTWGSLAAMIIAYFVMPLLYYPYFVALTLIILILGTIAADIHARILHLKDPKQIVIDELVGLWIACIIFAYFCPLGPISLILLFVLFRLFDMTKRPFIHHLERLKGGFGIMFDDVLAGIYAGAILVVAYKIYFALFLKGHM